MREESGEELLRRMTVRRRRDNIVVAVLSLLALVGGGNAVVGWLLPASSTDTGESVPVIVGHAQLASSFAEEFVVAYLSAGEGQRQQISRYVSAANELSLPKTRRQISDPAVVHVYRAATAPALDVWSVTVSVRGAQSGESPAGPREYYRVAVSVSDGHLRALALPALVEPPRTGADLATVYRTPCSADTPVAVAISGFLTAYLTGTGELNRYVSAASGISAPAPAPYSEVGTLTMMSDDSGCGTASSTLKALATATPSDRNGPAAPLTYPLTMVREAGQWQVRSIDPVPALTDPITILGGAGEPAPSAQPSPVVTPTVVIPPAKQN